MKIIITKPGNFDKKAKVELIKQGICLIEANEPESVKIISDADFGDANQIMFAAMDAIYNNNSSTDHSYFFKSMYKRIKQKDIGSAPTQ